MFSIFGCNSQNTNITSKSTMEKDKETKYDTATFGAGCFWCVEAIFAELRGVESVLSGYTGGTKQNPTYAEICTGETGHAEVAQITYDPSVTSYKELLEVFWQVHDPTSLNKQGADVGTQYRSAIFYRNQKQKDEAEFYLNRLNEEKVYDKPIVTQIEPMGVFYKAEDYHQNYYNDNSNQTYCVYVIKPKIEKFRKVFKDKLK
ncbi:MAG: peptide-methionine (S)-S-oxide reductase MsrA [Flavobacteriales bacterium]|nr:peptide-methionine (S)-S-oxide reductase MsrA [Flavobacteriales bacterium]